jgi:hypothetical protein
MEVSVLTNPMASFEGEGSSSPSKAIDATTDEGIESLVRSGIPVKVL